MGESTSRSKLNRLTEWRVRPSGRRHSVSPISRPKSARSEPLWSILPTTKSQRPCYFVQAKNRTSTFAKHYRHLHMIWSKAAIFVENHVAWRKRSLRDPVIWVSELLFSNS